MENQQNTADSIALRDIILNLRGYIVYLWKKKWWIGIAALLSAAVFVYRIQDESETFEGRISYAINSGEGGGSNGGVGSILGQIGLGGNSEIQLKKVNKMSKTYRTLSKVLLDSARVDGIDDLIGNHFIRVHDLGNTTFSKISAQYANYRFPHNRIEDFEYSDLTIIKYLYAKMILRSDDPILETTLEDETGTLMVTVNTQGEELTLALLNSVYEINRHLYVTDAVEPQQKTIDVLSVRADSLKKRLAQLEYQLANNQDRSLGLISNRERVGQQSIQRELSLTNSLYTEVLRNRESAIFLLRSAQPDLQLIELPILPLSSTEPSTSLAIILGLLFGGGLTALVLGLRHFFIQIMKDEQ